MEYSNVPKKQQKTQHKASSQKELAPERIKIQKLTPYKRKKKRRGGSWNKKQKS